MLPGTAIKRLALVAALAAAAAFAQTKIDLPTQAKGTLAVANGGTGTAAVPTSAQVPVGNAGGTAYAPQSVSGDGALSNAGVLTVTKTNGASFAPSATTDATNAANITSGTLPNARLSAVPNSALANSSVTVSGHSLSLGGTLSLSASDVGLGSVTNDVQTKAAVVPNTAPSAGQLHVGNAGGTAFGVVSMSGDAALASTGAITVTKTNGSAFAASATTDTTSAANISSGTLPAGRMPALTGDVTTSAGAVATSIANGAVTYAKIQNVSATSRFLGRITAGAGTAEELTAANAKTILSLTSSDVGLGSVTNDAQTKAAVVPNTAPSAGQVLAGNAGGTAYAPVSMSGDGTLSSAGALTVTKTNGSAFAASATTDTTSASNISAGTLAAARGGAGTVSGILKANGSGTVSAAAAGTDYASATSPFKSGSFASKPGSPSTGDMYLATDVGDAPGTLLTYNGTRWKPMNGRARLKTLSAAVSGLTNSEVITLQAALPAALLVAGDSIEAWVTLAKSGTTDTGSAVVRVGTAGTTSDTALQNATHLSAAQLTWGAGMGWKVASATSMQQYGAQGVTGSYQGASTISQLAAVTISNISNALFISVDAKSSSTTNTITMQSAYIDWITP